MYRIAICDDECLTCQEIENIILDNSDLLGATFDIEVFYSGEALIEHMRCGSSYDFLILDIELYGATGIDIGKYLRDEDRNFHTQIIYVSSKETYAMKLFSVQPLDFIVKPVQPKTLIKAINRGFEIIGRKEDFFTCKVGKDNLTISCKDILYLSSNKRIISVVCRDDSIDYYGKLSEELHKLPEYFVQVHNSYIINLNALKRSCNDYVVMNNNEQINISRKYSESFKEKIFSRWKRLNCGE
ncbi:MAG: response regulator transcription factor [Butyrivibrio sp.]|jgi:DNA-binding LytR/AlgR family response regulator|uniref:LytR/AlgR family response regulator transcription factor n=1 Tax=Butyrivibrio sp. TaxID=28121 RepID=UPI001ED5F307|nr:LytTR family DNA-binding domain-containing protein [Butyrivibrio sp.]MBE5840617.1 response regulator transcription factor [Butyrivibrio sp.]